MISIYTSFRSFQGHMGQIQRKALQSWLELDPQPQIIVIGGDEGSEEICQEFGILGVNINKSETGAPYIDEFIKAAEQNAEYDIMLLTSGDIILSQDTICAAKSVSQNMNEFCVCARKLHVDKDLTPVRWADWNAGDYFLHSKGMFKDIPEFLMGRCALDNWMFKRSIKSGVFVDGSKTITVLHQMHAHDNHNRKRYAEVSYNRSLYKKNDFSLNRWGKEIMRADICHANYVMTEDFSIVENVSPERDW